MRDTFKPLIGDLHLSLLLSVLQLTRFLRQRHPSSALLRFPPAYPFWTAARIVLQLSPW